MPKPNCSLAWLAKHHFGKFRVLCFLLCLSPALWLVGEWWSGTLGINPLNRLLHFSGRWALILLAMTLSVTPLRRLSMWLSQRIHALFGKRISDWNWLIRLRRQLGLFAFFYASLHLTIYLTLDTGPDWEALLEDLVERPFIALGLSAFVLLVPLAATSNKIAMRKLGRHWQGLHSLSYAIAVLALCHYWAHVKVGDLSPLPYTLVLISLLLFRVVGWRWGDRSHGVEANERDSNVQPLQFALRATGPGSAEPLSSQPPALNRFAGNNYRPQ